MQELKYSKLIFGVECFLKVKNTEEFPTVYFCNKHGRFINSEDRTPICRTCGSKIETMSGIKWFITRNFPGNDVIFDNSLTGEALVVFYIPIELITGYTLGSNRQFIEDKKDTKRWYLPVEDEVISFFKQSNEYELIKESFDVAFNVFVGIENIFEAEVLVEPDTVNNVNTDLIPI